MQKQKSQLRSFITTIAAVGTIAIGLAGCAVYPEPPPNHVVVTTGGPYSYYDYPDTYVYYDYNGQPMRSGYSNDPDLRYDARERPPGSHSDDHNFHNRGDYDHWDY